jgi:DNA-binding MarR family transcriptional regulator
MLERNGYISRTKSENDARMYQLNMTDETRGILEPLKMVFFSWTEILVDRFSQKEREEVFDYLERMRDNAKNKLHQMKEEK